MSSPDGWSNETSSDVWVGAPGHTDPAASRHVGSFDAPTPDPAAGLPRRGSARAMGTVANLKQRIETHRRLPTAQIVNFRLERYDERGNRLQPIPVEMRGLTITGYIADGERVQVVGRFHQGTLYTKKVKNVTTGGGISTQASGRLGRRIGRPAEITLIVLVLVAAVCCVRFIPQIYINTPMGLHEYENGVHSTCERLSKVWEASPPYTPNANGSIPRDQVLAGFESTVAGTQDAYRLLLSHNTPVVRRSRRDKVASDLPALTQYFADVHAELLALPAAISVNELTVAATKVEAEAAQVTATLDDAMSQLAGGTCHVS